MPARPAIAARCTMPFVEPPIACSTISALRKLRSVNSSVGRGVPAFAISTARLPLASAMRTRSACTAGTAAAYGSEKPERLDHARHRARRAHHHAGADRRREPPAHHLDLGLVHLAGAMLRPEPPAIRAGAEHLALVMADHHRTGRHHDRGLVGRDRAHHLRRQRLVAAADHHHGVHRLRAHHLLGVHRHQVAHVHRGRLPRSSRGSRWWGIPSAARRRASRRASPPRSAAARCRGTG